MLTRRGLAALFALLALLFGFSGVAAAAPEKPDDTTATSCTARPITDEEVSAEYVRTVDGSSEFSAYEAVEFGFGLALQEGHCEGDSITFTPPQELGSNGSPVDLTTDGGVVIAHAVFSESVHEGRPRPGRDPGPPVGDRRQGPPDSHSGGSMPGLLAA